CAVPVASTKPTNGSRFFIASPESIRLAQPNAPVVSLLTTVTTTKLLQVIQRRIGNNPKYLRPAIRGDFPRRYGFRNYHRACGNTIPPIRRGRVDFAQRLYLEPDRDEHRARPIADLRRTRHDRDHHLATWFRLAFQRFAHRVQPQWHEQNAFGKLSTQFRRSRRKRNHNCAV